MKTFINSQQNTKRLKVRAQYRPKRIAEMGTGSLILKTSAKYLNIIIVILKTKLSLK